ncbi:MAG: FG-GAP repeat protein, partial [Planctomycetota bacterium]
YARGSFGAAYVFRPDASSWVEDAQLTAADEELADIFGFDVAIDGDVILVGAHAADDGGLNSGVTHVFRRSGPSWIEQGKLRASDPEELDAFGWSVALDGARAVVGSYRDDEACPGSPECNSGSAYVFDVPSGCLCPEDLDGSGDVGFGDVLSVIGAWGPCAGCPQDLDGSGDVGFGDVLAVIGAWGGCG